MVEKLLPLLHSYSAFIHRLFEIIGGGGGAFVKRTIKDMIFCVRQFLIIYLRVFVVSLPRVMPIKSRVYN